MVAVEDKLRQSFQRPLVGGVGERFQCPVGFGDEPRGAPPCSLHGAGLAHQRDNLFGRDRLEAFFLQHGFDLAPSGSVAAL